MKSVTRYPIAIFAIIGILFVTEFATAQPTPPRVLKLDAQLTSGPNSGASGTLVLSSAAGLVFGELNIRKLRCLIGDPTREGGFYSVYMETPTTGTKPIFTFNTACTSESMHADFPMPDGPWLTEPLNVYIFDEGDDGVDAISAGNTLILFGSD